MAPWFMYPDNKGHIDQTSDYALARDSTFLCQVDVCINCFLVLLVYGTTNKLFVLY